MTPRTKKTKTSRLRLPLVAATKDRRGTAGLAAGCLRSRRNNRRLSVLSAILVLFCVALGFAGDKKKPGQEPFALIAGSVFREPGYALPEAKVVLIQKDAPKGKKLETLTSPRGEFTFRVPPVAATYVLKASFKGFRPEEKEAVVTGEDRVDVTFVLVPESK